MPVSLGMEQGLVVHVIIVGRGEQTLVKAHVC